MILCSFQCRSCRMPMRIPQHTLLREFEHLNPPPTGIPYVALLCPRCKTAGTYSEADLVESGVSGISPNWAVLDWLQCGEEGCTPRVPLFELRNTDQTSSGPLQFRDLLCSLPAQRTSVRSCPSMPPHSFLDTLPVFIQRIVLPLRQPLHLNIRIIGKLRPERDQVPFTLRAG